MSPIVVDASVAATWLMSDEQSEFADATREKVMQSGAMAPTLFWYEVRNMLVINERKRRLTSQQIDEALAALATLPLRRILTSDESLVLALARRHRPTFYDAAYLALAIDEGAPLATLDTQLATAARQEGVELLT